MRAALIAFSLSIVPPNVADAERASASRIAGASGLLVFRASRNLDSICAASIEAARTRCVETCAGMSYSFSPGVCGTASTCRCGEAASPEKSLER